MIEIIKYKAVDGVEFNDKEACADYELLILEANQIMSNLPKLPKEIDSTDFANGCGYIQHDKEALKTTKVKLLKLCQKHVDHKWIQQTIDIDNVHPSWVSRILGDYGISPLCKAWDRFSRIDKNYREWGQPYFALNPEQGTQKCLNIK